MAESAYSGGVDENNVHFHPATKGNNPYPACEVSDKDYHFLIDAIDRSIKPYPESSQNTPNAGNKTKIMQYDHLSEIFTIEAPRWVEGHDMLRCNRIEIHFINSGDTGSNEGIHLIDTENNLKLVDEDPNRVMFTWPISMAATQYVGVLAFAVHFACSKPAEKTEDGMDTEAELLYAWNTLAYNKIQVGKGINNTEIILDKYQDILAQWEYKLAVGVQSVKQTTKSFESGGVNIIRVTLTDGRTTTFEIRNGLSPQKGVDYWTESDKAEILQYIFDKVPAAEEATF